MKRKLQCKTVLKYAGEMKHWKGRWSKTWSQPVSTQPFYTSHDPQTFIQVHLKDEPPFGYVGRGRALGGIKQNQGVEKKDLPAGFLPSSVVSRTQSMSCTILSCDCLRHTTLLCGQKAWPASSWQLPDFVLFLQRRPPTLFEICILSNKWLIT